MNSHRIKGFHIGILAIALMLLVPPWKYRIHVRAPSESVDLAVSGPYHLVFLGAPAIPSDPGGEGDTFRGFFRKVWFAELDVGRLILQIIAVGAISGVLFIRQKSG
jgi:hypothetical protein